MAVSWRQMIHRGQKLVSKLYSKMAIPQIDQIFDRAYGCILGQAIGDALGTRYEFKNSAVTKSMIESDFKKHNSTFLPILGGGPFSMEPGQTTDDTEMAMALARSLQRSKIFDLADIANSYATWFHSSPPDIGMTTSNAFEQIRRTEISKLSKEKVLKLVLKSSEERNRSSLSNGCLMRISPLAVAGSQWPLETLRKAAIADCRLTHPNPVTHDAVAAYVTAIWYLINTGDRKRAYDEAIKRVETDQIRQLLEITDNPAIPIISQNGDHYIDGDSAHMGYLGVALKWAFMELRMKGDDFEKALISVVSRGGDTDTNGCIAAAMLGAYVGASRIPEQWKKTVMEARPRRLERYDWVDMKDAEQLTKDLLDVAAPEVADCERSGCAWFVW